MKAILKTATIQGISIQEARAQHNRLYSRAVHSAQRAAPAPLPLPSRSDCINPQIAALQAELKNVKDTIIPNMSQSIKSLTAELAATKEKISLIDTRFDSFESQLGANASSQSARFDKLEQLISSLTNAIKPQVTP
jgi:chromosome segregation ATPase